MQYFITRVNDRTANQRRGEPDNRMTPRSVFGLAPTSSTAPQCGRRCTIFLLSMVRIGQVWKPTSALYDVGPPCITRHRPDVGPIPSRPCPDIGPTSENNYFYVGPECCFRHRPDVGPIPSRPRPDIGPTSETTTFLCRPQYASAIGPMSARCSHPKSNVLHLIITCP